MSVVDAVEIVVLWDRHFALVLWSSISKSFSWNACSWQVFFSRVQVDGKILCLLCTINYKKAQFKKRTQEEKVQKPHSTSRHHKEHRCLA